MLAARRGTEECHTQGASNETGVILAGPLNARPRRRTSAIVAR